MDDDPGGHEEERLEEGVRHQVEEPGAVRAEADADEHVADLAHRRVRDDALDVRLDERDSPATSERHGAEDAREVVDVDASSKSGVRAGDQVDAGGDHRRRVDEGADRGRALHRVREPRVERDLRRLGHGAAEEPERDEHRERVLSPSASGASAKTVAKSSEPICWMRRKSASAKVASPTAFMMNAFLPAATASRRSVPEVDQQVRGEADHAPAGEEEQEVPRLDEQEHGEDEERLVGVVAPLLVVAVHVADRVGEDQEADARRRPAS